MASRLITLGKQAGFRGLFAGLAPRMIMTAGLVSGQFLIYGAIKDGASPPFCELTDYRRTNGIVLYSVGRTTWSRDS